MPNEDWQHAVVGRGSAQFPRRVEALNCPAKVAQLPEEVAPVRARAARVGGILPPDAVRGLIKLEVGAGFVFDKQQGNSRFITR